MPHKSLREIRADLKRAIHTERYVDCLLVVQDSTGLEILRSGGRWDRLALRYVPGTDVVPYIARLQESQDDLGRAFARWLEGARRGDAKLPRVIIAGGNRGSGKTWFLAGIVMTVFALEWPRDWQFGVNLASAQKRECIDSIREASLPAWIDYESQDLRDPVLRFANGSTIGWLSSQNPKRLRQAKLRIRHVLLNEGQDQAEKNFINAISAIRNTTGLVTIATNPPQQGAGDWVAGLWNSIEGGEVGHRAEIYNLDNKKNRAVNQEALGDIAILLRAVSEEAADADAGGNMRKLSGLMAYNNFLALPFEKLGHLGDPPPIPMIGAGPWRDVTRDKTSEKLHGGEGREWIVGCDFQRRPGIVGVACKLFLVEKVWAPLPLPVGTLVLWAADQINCAGDESSFSAMLERRGYSPFGLPVDGRPTRSAFLVGDGTGARQNAAHRWELPPSFQSLAAEGWTIVPPSKTSKGKPWNPAVKESRAQMWDGFDARQIIVSPGLKTSEPGFGSLVSSLSRAKVNRNGNLVGGNHHAPDGLRYIWYCFGPRPMPPRAPMLDDKSFNELRSIKILTSG